MFCAETYSENRSRAEMVKSRSAAGSRKDDFGRKYAQRALGGTAASREGAAAAPTVALEEQKVVEFDGSFFPSRADRPWMQLAVAPLTPGTQRVHRRDAHGYAALTRRGGRRRLPRRRASPSTPPQQLRGASATPLRAAIVPTRAAGGALSLQGKLRLTVAGRAAARAFETLSPLPMRTPSRVLEKGNPCPFPRWPSLFDGPGRRVLNKTT